MGRKKQKRVLVIDAETDPFKYGRIPEPFVWGVYDGETFHYFWGFDCTAKLIEFLQGEDDAVVYAHNGGKFDFHFLLPYLDPDLFIINGRIAKATLHDKKIELRDSWLILPLPLSAHDKGEIDYNKMERGERDRNKNEIIRYLNKDCVSLFDWVMGFRNQFGDGLTLAGTAFKELRKTSYQVTRTYDAFDKPMREFYFGGRVQCLQVGAFKGPLKYWDINSAYPYAMLSKHWHGSDYVEHLRLPEKEHGSWYAKIDAQSFGALPFRHDGKLYFPDDGLTRTFFASGWEIIAGLETGTLKIKKVHRVFIPKRTADFSEYVDTFFKMKLDAEQTGNKVMRQFAKLLLNSCYGKFGQDGREFKKFKLCEHGFAPDDEYDNWQFHADTESGMTIFERPDPSDYFFNVATAGSVTAFVRAYLWRAICSSEGVLYCDTDSLICKGFSGVTGDKLGAWKLEADIAEAYIAQRKMYALLTVDGEHKTASKGVRLSYNQIKEGVLSGQDILSEKEAPAFSLKYGARFFKRNTNFKNIAKNACNNPF